MDRAGTRRVVVGVVVFAGLYQGAVPMVVRSLFGADQRGAVALWLPSPWWWIACLAITATTAAVALHLSDQQSSPPSRKLRDEGGGYDALAGLVLLAGTYNGVAPFIAQLVFDGNLFLALPVRLEAPWWWLTSLAVIVTTVVLLAVIDNAKQRRTER